MKKPEGCIRLNLNNPVFQEQLLTLQKAERHAALDTLNKIRQLTWNQLYRDGEYVRLLTIAPDHDATYRKT